MNNNYFGRELLLVFVMFGIVFGVLIYDSYTKGDGDVILPVLITMGIIAVTVMVIFLVYFGVLNFKYRNVKRVLREKGPCEELLEVYMHDFKSPTYNQQLVAADLALCLEKFEQCEAILQQLPGELILRGRDKAMYYKTYLCLFLNTGRYTQASDLFVGCRKYLDDFYKLHKLSAKAYYDDAALVCAVRGDLASADNYRLLCDNTTVKSNTYNFIPQMIMAELFIIDGQFDNAERAIADGHRLIDSTAYKEVWERDYSHFVLDKGAALAKRIRNDISN